MLLVEQILSFESKTHFGKAMLAKGAKVVPLSKMAEKH